MAVLPTNLARVSNLLRTSVATSSMSKTQRMLLEVQNQLTTGYRINRPSDDPGDSAVVQQMQKTLEKRQAHLDNISAAKNTLATTDTALDGLTDLLRQAKEIASANVGSDVTPAERESAAAIIDNLYNQALTYGNTQFEGSFVFGGDRSNAKPFDNSGTGGVRFVGSNTVLTNEFDEGTNLAFMVSAEDVFGAMSDGRLGSSDLAPRLSPVTRLSDLDGTLFTGVYKGKINITNGGTSATVDLSDADTIGDVLTRINAVSGTTNVNAAIATDGTIDLTATTGTVAVNDVAGGTTARDLGILQPVAAATVDGADAQPRVTEFTALADLRGGLGLDATGFTITNGSKAATITTAGLTTVGDLLNRINGSGTEVIASINKEGTTLNILNPVQGASMTISENGGSTASQMGLRTMSPGHLLSELNDGKGVRTVAGPDITITRQDGTAFSVDLDGLATVNDVMNAINAAAGTGMAGFAASGNGIVLTDTTTGATPFRVEPAGFSPAAGDLGLLAAPAVGGVITGADVNPESTAGVFSNLTRLRDALRASDQTKITESATGIEEDLARIARVRGVTGARVQELESRENRITDENLATQTLLSGLQETDYTTAITKYTTLQTSLEAAMKTTSQVSNMSLLDFLG